MFRNIVIAMGYWLILTRDANAYLDPGTGTIILQGLIAGAATGLYFVRSKFQLMVSFLTGKGNPRGEGDSGDH
jgi:hypothetical protein